MKTLCLRHGLFGNSNPSDDSSLSSIIASEATQSSSSAKETTAITEMQFHKMNWDGPVQVFDMQGRFLGSETPRIAENRKRSAGKI